MPIYEKLGVRRVINAHGTMTALGGSLMEPETLQAMAEAASSFVDLRDLLTKAGSHIASLIGVEGVCITSGAAAGLVIATAACLRDGTRNRVIVQRCQRNDYFPFLRLAGAELLEIGDEAAAQLADLESALTDGIAAVVHFANFNDERAIPLSTVIRVAQQRGIPTIVDAAAELPPISNLSYFYDWGASLVIFSGGKMIRGPQSTGLIIGREPLVSACAALASPNMGIGRPMKVGKEEIAGLVTAVERFLAHDFEADRQRWERQVERCLQLLRQVEGTRAERIYPGQDQVLPRDVPRVAISWDEATIRLSPSKARRLLLDGEPSIAVGEMPGGLVINPIVLREGEEDIVAWSLATILMRAPSTH